MSCDDAAHIYTPNQPRQLRRHNNNTMGAPHILTRHTQQAMPMAV